MRVKEFTITPIERIDTEGLSLVDWYVLHEQKLHNTSLLESLNQTDINFLDGLSSYAVANPIVGEQYIPAFIMMLSNNSISYYGETKLCEFIGSRIEGSLQIYEFKKQDGQSISWPQSKLSSLSYSKLYLFTNEHDFNTFRSNIALKFMKHIPEAEFK